MFFFLKIHRGQRLNSFSDSVIIFAKCLDPDQARAKIFDTLLIFLKTKKSIKGNQQTTIHIQNYKARTEENKITYPSNRCRLPK